VLARALALALLWTGVAAAEVAVPPLSARVTDLTSTLDAGQRAALEARLEAFERAKGSQVVVLIVPTTQPETIEQYSIRVADAWKIGRHRGIDDGVIVVLAIDDHAVRIEVGDGLEGALPDAIANRITDDVMVPRFRIGDYYGGLSDGIERILAVIAGEPLPQPSPPDVRIPRPDWLFWIVVPPLLLGSAIRRFHNRFSGGAVAGGLAGGLAWWLTHAPGISLFAAILCFVLASGRGGRHYGWSSGGFGGFGGGGFGGGFGGGGFGGGGGFSGGGGHFSGGGASGHW
jgi:uncharacterized protein